MTDYKHEFQMNLYSNLSLRIKITDLNDDPKHEIEIKIDGAGRVTVSQQNRMINNET